MLRQNHDEPTQPSRQAIHKVNTQGFSRKNTITTEVLYDGFVTTIKLYNNCFVRTVSHNCNRQEQDLVLL